MLYFSNTVSCVALIVAVTEIVFHFEKYITTLDMTEVTSCLFFLYHPLYRGVTHRTFLSEWEKR